jgi:hypothetical protein
MTLRGTVKRDFTPSLLETVAPRRRRARPSVDAAKSAGLPSRLPASSRVEIAGVCTTYRPLLLRASESTDGLAGVGSLEPASSLPATAPTPRT